MQSRQITSKVMKVTFLDNKLQNHWKLFPERTAKNPHRHPLCKIVYKGKTAPPPVFNMFHVFCSLGASSTQNFATPPPAGKPGIFRSPTAHRGAHILLFFQISCIFSSFFLYISWIFLAKEPLLGGGGDPAGYIHNAFIFLLYSLNFLSLRVCTGEGDESP